MAPTEPASPQVQLTRPEQLTDDHVEAVRDMAREVARHDEFEAISEQMLLNLTSGRQVQHILLTAAAAVVGYGQIDDGAAELTVHPAWRGQDLGRRALHETLREPGVHVWAHGDLPAAAHLAAQFGLQRVRDLWVMAMDPPETVPPTQEREGVRVREFSPGQDEDAWLELNARAFADHPEQGKLTRADLDERMGQPWFDPALFFLAEDAATGELLGSMWLKVQDGVGEIYALGVHPQAQGRGIGGLLTSWAMSALTAARLNRLELYVEGENAAAIRTYRRVGFTKERADVQYTRA